MSCAYNNF